MASEKLPRGIRRRGKKFLVSVYHNGDRKYATCETLEEAIKRQAELKEEMTGGNTPDTPSQVQSERAPEDTWTLLEAKERTLASYWKGTRGEQAALKNIQFALRFFGEERPIHTITTEDIDRYTEYLEGLGNSNSTINRKMSALSKVMTCAVERGKMDAKPKLTRKREGQGRIRFLTPTEEVKLLATMQKIEKHDHYDATVVFLDTGMRMGELWRLAGRDIHWENDTLTIWQTKTGRPRTLIMTDRVKEVIARRVKKYGEQRLFPYDNGWYRNTWDRVRSMLGYADDPQFIPYVLRHTCCSRMVQGNIHLKHVMVWMGHTCIQTTLRYSHLAPTDLEACVDVLEDSAAQKCVAAIN
ncbi:tyrosine-type recombinase/integrase [Desulfovibrio oxyclinae]|uniref:tyrosine-type recombinase/integrase n=1 Tax=Desulfovibrio oxyclinae TaxID=63560 RepID=UPI0003697DC1|nr:site-specific integrase [Desulfovibrio oxyclinae]